MSKPAIVQVRNAVEANRIANGSRYGCESKTSIFYDAQRAMSPDFTPIQQGEFMAAFFAAFKATFKGATRSGYNNIYTQGYIAGVRAAFEAAEVLGYHQKEG